MSHDFETINIFGFNVFNQTLDSIPINDKLVINTLNAHSYQVAKEDTVFKNALLESDILIPDGESIVFAAKILRGKKIRKIAGYDLFIYFLNVLNNNSGSCFFLGSTNSTLELIRKRIAKEFPKIKVCYFSPPFKDEFSKSENQEMITEINNFNPDVLFVGMTAPKQEKWVFKNKKNISSNQICCVGAVFDFYSETIKRPPNIIVKLKLEWLGRLLSNPKRMWRRYLLSTPVFFIDVFKSLLRH